MRTKAVAKTTYIIAIAVIIIIAGIGYYLIQYPAITPKAQFTYACRATDLTTLDPAEAGTDEARYLAAVYDTLIRVKPGTGSEIEPSLATSWEASADGLHWTFHLREGVKAHDGSYLTAECVKLSFERVIKINKGAAIWFTMVEDVTVLDDRTAVVNLKQPYSSFLATIASRTAAPIVSAKAIKEHEVSGDMAQGWLKSHEAGFGPYMLKEVVSMQYILFEKFPDYWRGWEGKHVDEVMIRWISEPGTQRMMLLNKELDLAEAIPEEFLPDLDKNPEFKVVFAPTLVTCFWIMSLQGTLKDIRLRQMVAYAFDYESALNMIWQGKYSSQMQGLLASMAFGFDDSIPLIKYNLTRARELRQEAGYKEGELTLRAVYNVGFEWKRKTIELLQSKLSEIGVNVQIEEVTWPVLWEACVNPNAPYDLIPYYQNMETFEPILNLRSLFHSSSIGITINKGINSSMLDNLIERAESETDRAKYEDLLKQIQQATYPMWGIVPLYEMTFPFPMQAHVKGYYSNPINPHSYYYYELYIED